MATITPQDNIKKTLSIGAGVFGTYAAYKIIRALIPAAVEAPGKTPPGSLLWGNLSWASSKGPVGSKGYSELFEGYFEEQNQKSFWTVHPYSHPSLHTVDPVVIKEAYSCPYKWTKPAATMERFKDYLGEGIFNTNGTKWRIQRKQASYMFSDLNLREVVLPAIEVSTAKFVSKLHSLSPNEAYDLQKGFQDIMMDTFAKVAYGWDSNTFDTDSTFGYNFDRILRLHLYRLVNPFWKIARLLNVGHEKELAERLKRHKESIRKVVVPAISKKGEVLSKSKILIERLLDITKKGGEPMGVETMVDFVTNFLIAGRDTTSSTMTWAIYNLIRFPETRQKILDSVRHAKEAHPDDLWEQLKAMTYVEAWIYESLRFYCPVPTTAKDNKTSSTISLKDGSVMPQDSKVYIRIQACSWNPKIWKNPREFNPERHIKDGKLSIKSTEEFPVFNGGKRLCLGKKMALIFAKVMMSELVPQFEFSLAEEKEAPEHVWGVTARSKTGMWVNVKKLPVHNQ